MIPTKVPATAIFKDPVAIDRDAKLANAINQILGMLSMPDDTTLRITLVGSDGVSRSVDLTLA
jgi:hypothetical protein